MKYKQLFFNELRVKTQRLRPPCFVLRRPERGASLRMNACIVLLISCWGFCEYTALFKQLLVAHSQLSSWLHWILAVLSKMVATATGSPDTLQPDPLSDIN